MKGLYETLAPGQRLEHNQPALPENKNAQATNVFRLAA